ncbi:MAG TPA: hypothetical protein VKR58_08500 [Aquella sp.]|nr:hypothetical protein [Aquella sp.]
MAERAAVSGIQPNSISIQIELNQKKYWGFLNPSVQQLQPGIPVSFELYFWGEFQGTITYALDGWACSKSIDQVVLNAVGNYLLAWYE